MRSKIPDETSVNIAMREIISAEEERQLKETIRQDEERQAAEKARQLEQEHQVAIARRIAAAEAARLEREAMEQVQQRELMELRMRMEVEAKERLEWAKIAAQASDNETHSAFMLARARVRKLRIGLVLTSLATLLLSVVSAVTMRRITSFEATLRDQQVFCKGMLEESLTSLRGARLAVERLEQSQVEARRRLDVIESSNVPSTKCPSQSYRR